MATLTAGGNTVEMGGGALSELTLTTIRRAGEKGMTLLALELELLQMGVTVEHGDLSAVLNNLLESQQIKTTGFVDDLLGTTVNIAAVYKQP